MALKSQILETINQNNFDELVKFIEQDYISVSSCIIQYIANENITGLSFLMDNYESDVLNFTYKNCNILTLVCQYGWLDAVKLLIDLDIPIETSSNYLKTPLFASLIYDQLEIVDYLMEIKPEMIQELLDDGNNLVHLLVQLGNNKLLKHILPKVKEYNLLNSRNKNGLAPLHMAVMSNNLETVTILIENKAGLTLLNNKSQTVLEIAFNEDYTDIFNYLKENSKSDYFENISLGA